MPVKSAFDVSLFSPFLKVAQKVTNKIRVILPTVILILVGGQYYVVWLTWRILGYFLPKRVFDNGCDIIMEYYFRYQMFFLEAFAGIKVWRGTNTSVWI